MAAAGFTYLNPWQPNDQPKWKDPAKRTEQVNTAIADVDCKQNVNLVGVWMAAESAYQRTAIRDNGAALDTLRKNLQTQAANARAAPTP